MASLERISRFLPPLPQYVRYLPQWLKRGFARICASAVIEVIYMNGEVVRSGEVTNVAPKSQWTAAVKNKAFMQSTPSIFFLNANVVETFQVLLSLPLSAVTV